MMFSLILYVLYEQQWTEQWRMSHLPKVGHVSVAVDTSTLQVNMTVILSVMGFPSDKCFWSRQTGSTTSAWQPHTPKLQIQRVSLKVMPRIVSLDFRNFLAWCTEMFLYVLNQLWCFLEVFCVMENLSSDRLAKATVIWSDSQKNYPERKNLHLLMSYNRKSHNWTIYAALNYV